MSNELELSDTLDVDGETSGPDPIKAVYNKYFTN